MNDSTNKLPEEIENTEILNEQLSEASEKNKENTEIMHNDITKNQKNILNEFDGNIHH